MRSLRKTRFMLWLDTGSTEARFIKVFFYQIIATMACITIFHYVLRPYHWALFSKMPLVSEDDWVTCICVALGSAWAGRLSQNDKPKQAAD